MHPFWSALAAAGRRRRRSARGRDVPSGRLMVGELRRAVGQAVHPVKMTAAALVALGVGVVLGPTTPGPVLGAGWRSAVAVVLGLVALAVAHALLQRRTAAAPDDPLAALRVTVAVVGLVVAGTIVLAYLLAVITGSPASGSGGGLSASLAIDTPLLAGATLLVAGVLTAGVSHRIALPGSLLFLALGMLIGSDGLGWVELAEPELVQSLGVVALVVILFDGGLTTDPARLRIGVGPGVALATVGVAVTAGVTAVGTLMLLDVPSRVAWLIGAVVASTDAAAVFALLRRAPIPERLAAVLQIESGANDPVAVLLTVGLLSAWDAPPTAGAWLGFGALQLVGGVAVGVAVGAAGALLLRRAELGTGGLYPVLALATAGVAYGAAVAVGASGFLATYLAGIVVAYEAPRRRGTIRSFVGALANGVEVGLFLLLGLLVLPSELVDVALVALGVTALLVFVARPLATWLSLAWFDLSGREVAATSWLGMRGAVPIVLATLAFSAGIEEAALVFDVVFFVVLTSALLQGTTAVPVIRRLGLETPPSPARAVVEALPLETAGVDVVEVVLGRDSPLVGRALQDCAPPQHVLITAVVRAEAVLLPRGTTRLRAGDRLVVATTDQQRGVAVVEAWVRGAVTPSG